MIWTQIFAPMTILTLGVVYGADMFFAVVARSAIASVSEAGITEVMGRLHEVADRRMPIFGLLGMLFTVALIAVAPSITAITALAAQLIHLGIYFRVPLARFFIAMLIQKEETLHA